MFTILKKKILLFVFFFFLVKFLQRKKSGEKNVITFRRRKSRGSGSACTYTIRFDLEREYTSDTAGVIFKKFFFLYRIG